MPSKNPAQRLRDIVENIDAIQVFIENLDLAAFRADRKTVHAEVRALEVIPEASRRLPAEVTQRRPEI
ncbi:MAG TPA: HepT-like ribonuclease domain-containing protein [Bryobacteraceae bacterium]|nr:HepT-like ribonuclease domain-containing protein [Bryobacteraceae bacterium]